MEAVADAEDASPTAEVGFKAAIHSWTGADGCIVCGGAGRFGGRRAQFDEHGVYYNGVYVPNPDLAVTAQWARSQM